MPPTPMTNGKTMGTPFEVVVVVTVIGLVSPVYCERVVGVNWSTLAVSECIEEIDRFLQSLLW